MGDDLTSEQGFPDSARDANPGWTRAELLMWRFRWVIALGTLTCVVATGLVTWSAPRTYRVRAVLHTGDLRDDRREVDRLVARINAETALARMTRTQAGTPGGSAELRSPGIIELVVVGAAPEAGISMIEASSQALLAELNRLMELQTAQRLRTERLVGELRDGMERMRERIRAMQEAPVRQPSIPASARAAEAGMVVRLVMDLSFAEARLADLEGQVRLLEMAKQGPRLAVAAAVEQVSIRRRLAVNLAISLVVGLAASLALAQAWQWLRRGAARAADRA